MIGMKNPETGKLERLTGGLPTTTDGGFEPTPDQLATINTPANEIVKTTGEQTIDGYKTFTDRVTAKALEVTDTESCAVMRGGLVVMGKELYMENHNIKSLADPVADTDAVNKRYADNATPSLKTILSNKITARQQGQAIIIEFDVPIADIKKKPTYYGNFSLADSNWENYEYFTMMFSGNFDDLFFGIVKRNTEIINIENSSLDNLDNVNYHVGIRIWNSIYTRTADLELEIGEIWYTV